MALKTWVKLSNFVSVNNTARSIFHSSLFCFFLSHHPHHHHPTANPSALFPAITGDPWLPMEAHYRTDWVWQISCKCQAPRLRAERSDWLWQAQRALCPLTCTLWPPLEREKEKRNRFRQTHLHNPAPAAEVGQPLPGSPAPALRSATVSWLDSLDVPPPINTEELDLKPRAVYFLFVLF